MPVVRPPSQEGCPSGSSVSTQSPSCDAILLGDVHVDQHPAGLLQAVAVQVERHHAALGAHHQAGRRGGDPGHRDGAGRLAGDGGKIQRAARGAGGPGDVRAGGQAPALAGLEGQLERGLGHAGGEERLDAGGGLPGIAKHLTVQLQQATWPVERLQPVALLAVELGGQRLHGSRTGVQAGADAHMGAVGEDQLDQRARRASRNSPG